MLAACSVSWAIRVFFAFFTDSIPQWLKYLLLAVGFVKHDIFPLNLDRREMLSGLIVRSLQRLQFDLANVNNLPSAPNRFARAGRGSLQDQVV